MGVEEWAEKIKNRTRKNGGIVAQEHVGEYFVSTVWLGIDHNFGVDGPALIFETMVFPRGDSSEEYCERYATLEDAKAGHVAAVAMAERGEFGAPERE